MAAKETSLSDGELSPPTYKRKDGSFVHKLKCCDCGLVHLMSYTVGKRTLRFRAWREDDSIR